MVIIRLVVVLYKIKLLSPLGLYRFLTALYRYGVNISVLLQVATKFHGEKIALVDDDGSLSYQDLLAQVKKIATVLQKDYQIQKGHRAALLCGNHGSLVKSTFALSLLGADIYLLNRKMGGLQLNKLVASYQFDFLIYDQELSSLVNGSQYSKGKILSYHHNQPAINNLASGEVGEVPLPQRVSSKIVLLTSGTTGNFKTAAHKPSLGNYLSPFLAWLDQLKLLSHNTVYIATPLYHGYGIAVLLLVLTLGKKAILTKGFEAKRACFLIRDYQVTMVTVVPIMLSRLLRCGTEDLASITCIASGGAPLSPNLVEETFQKLGPVLYNLYGTSEGGLNTIATPQDLIYSPLTIGKKIKGSQLKIVDKKLNQLEAGQVGQLYVKNSWSLINRSTDWIATGDLAYQDNYGYFFLCGRLDDMIISGGQNVYPIETEQILITHPLVEDVAVIGTNDEDFGQRLKAFILPLDNARLTEGEITEWLKPRVASYQVPKEIVFVKTLPYSSLGKLDKKHLKLANEDKPVNQHGIFRRI